MNVNVMGGRGLVRWIHKVKTILSNVKSVRVGVPKSAGNYEKGPHTAVIAAMHEFGSDDGRIPERSFLRAGVNEALPEIKKIHENFMPEILEGKASADTMQRMVGEVAQGSITELIELGIDPPNAPSTIAKKGSDTPLVDTGHLRQSIKYELVDPGNREWES